MKHKALQPKDITRKWYVVDAEDIVLGRLSTKVAQVLIGKHRPYYSPQWDMGDHVIIVNADKVRLTGNKEEQKHYYRHSGYPGGLRSRSAKVVRSTHPERLLESSIYGMLPKNRLRKQFLTKLYVYAGGTHPHEAQQPEALEI